jgi:hypothetical protein
MDVCECDFGGKPFPNVEWPPNLPRGTKPPRIADLYPQETLYLDLDPPSRKSQVETEGSGEASRCRVVEKVTVTQRVVDIYCVRSFVIVRRKVSKKVIGAAIAGAGVVAVVAAPVLVTLHVVAAAGAAIIAGTGTGAVTAGGGLRTLSPKTRRDPATEEKSVYEKNDNEVKTRVYLEPGPWRACRDVDHTHMACVQHG